MNPADPALAKSARNVVVHVHLFKNAGTSVEASLREAFGERWASYDGGRPGQRLLQVDLEAFLAENPAVHAVSSHQVRPPLASSHAFRYLPVVFLRNPIDRLRSAYEFEREQGPVSPSAEAAAAGPLSSWIDFHDGRGSHQCSNFQTLSLSSIRNDLNGAPLMRRPMEEHAQSAHSFLEGLGAVGIVEQYSASMAAMQRWLGRELGEIDWTEQFLNTGPSRVTSIDDRLAAVEAELGSARYAELVAANQADLELHATFMKRLSSDGSDD